MADIELDDFGDHREDRRNQLPEDREEDREDQETAFDDDWRYKSILGLDDNPGGEIPKPKKDAGVIRRAYTEDKKNLLRELNINFNKGDGRSLGKVLFERLKVTVNRKGKINGAEFDGVRIIVQRGKGVVFTEDVKKVQAQRIQRPSKESGGRTQEHRGGVDGGNPRRDRRREPLRLRP